MTGFQKKKLYAIKAVLNGAGGPFFISDNLKESFEELFWNISII